MKKIYDACTGRRYTAKTGEQKTAWVKIGTAFDKEGRLSCRLDALPLPNDKGEVWISFFEQKPKDRTESEDDPPF